MARSVEAAVEDHLEAKTAASTEVLMCLLQLFNRVLHSPSDRFGTVAVCTVWRILEILERIRIRESVSLTDGSSARIRIRIRLRIRLRILLFSSVIFKMAFKFFCLFLFEATFTSFFSKIKSHKGVAKQHQSRFFSLFLLDEESGSVRYLVLIVRIQEV